MAIEKTALLGLHTPSIGLVVQVKLETSGYRVTRETTAERVLSRCRERELDIYIMDVNLGTPGSLDITPGQQVQDYLQERGLANRLYVLSNNDDTLRRAQQAGMQAYLTLEFTSVDL